MKLIANVNRSWGIGKDGKLLFHIPNDMRFFREKTRGNIVVMGKNTFLSLPGSKPLPDRFNIVLSRKGNDAPGVEDSENLCWCTSVQEVERIVKDRPEEDIYVIGGGEIYRQMLPLCNTAYITQVDSGAPADVWMPDLDAAPDWKKAEILSRGSQNGLSYTICRYERTAARENEANG